MRQRQHRQWLAAQIMVLLSLPACSNSYTSSVTPLSVAPSTLDSSSTSIHGSPHMFLSSRATFHKNVIDVSTVANNKSLSRFGGRARSSESTTFDNVDNADANTRRQRRQCLGFDTTTTSRSSSSSRTCLKALDSSKWNNVHEMDLSSSSSSPIKDQVATSLFVPSSKSKSSSLETSGERAFLPWIPTSRRQIDSLKLLELKQACADRGLKKSGLKAELQQRLWEWSQTASQQQALIPQSVKDTTAIDMGLGLKDVYSTTTTSLTTTTRTKPTFRTRARGSRTSTTANDDDATVAMRKSNNRQRTKPQQQEEDLGNDDEEDGDNDEDNNEQQQPPSTSVSLKANSLAEWSRDGVDQLLSRRKAIHREKLNGKPKRTASPKSKAQNHRQQPPSEYRSYLTKAFEASSSTKVNNRQVKQLYAAAKAADQAGDRDACRELLQRLKVLTPHDGRVWRRLARMETEEGRVETAIAILQEATRIMPDNGYLWHGLGQLHVSPTKQRQCYQKAIAVDPSLPHAHHALGTLEHMQGRIAVAMKVLKRGIQYCPTNHRLHHALGDIFREAKMLDMAEKSYLRALEHGPKVSHCFAYTALAFLSYERGEIDDCRHWLRKSVSLNRGRHSQGWVALAQMEEAEGNIDGARAVCIGAISQYERGLWKRHGKLQFEGDPMAMKETLFRKTVPQYRSGDKFVNVFRNWARLEQTYGHPETVDEVYTRATIAFPYDWKLTVNWAQYHASEGHVDRAKVLFEEGCKTARNRHADPYRLYAEYEMSFGNYEEARKVLFRGARAMADSSDGDLGGNRNSLAELYHTWAICEWHLGDLSRAEVLFDDALRLNQSGEEGTKLRSSILYSVARFHYFRGEYELAQHCIGLCLKEAAMPGGMSMVWDLWAEVASTMGNEHLAHQCEEQAAALKKEEREIGTFGLFLTAGRSKPDDLTKMVGASSQPLMRRDPWHDKIFSGFHRNVELPSKSSFREEDEFVVNAKESHTLVN